MALVTGMVLLQLIVKTIKIVWIERMSHKTAVAENPGAHTSEVGSKLPRKSCRLVQMSRLGGPPFPVWPTKQSLPVRGARSVMSSTESFQGTAVQTSWRLLPPFPPSWFGDLCCSGESGSEMLCRVARLLLDLFDTSNEGEMFRRIAKLLTFGLSATETLFGLVRVPIEIGKGGDSDTDEAGGDGLALETGEGNEMAPLGMISLLGTDTGTCGSRFCGRGGWSTLRGCIALFCCPCTIATGNKPLKSAVKTLDFRMTWRISGCCCCCWALAATSLMAAAIDLDKHFEAYWAGEQWRRLLTPPGFLDLAFFFLFFCLPRCFLFCDLDFFFFVDDPVAFSSFSSPSSASVQ